MSELMRGVERKRVCHGIWWFQNRVPCVKLPYENTYEISYTYEYFWPSLCFVWECFCSLPPTQSLLHLLQYYSTLKKMMNHAIVMVCRWIWRVICWIKLVSRGTDRMTSFICRIERIGSKRKNKNQIQKAIETENWYLIGNISFSCSS